jgi:hypothetical protein
LLGPNQTYEAILKILSKGKKHNLVEQNKFRELVINEKNTFLNEVKRFVQMIDRANG